MAGCRPRGGSGTASRLPLVGFIIAQLASGNDDVQPEFVPRTYSGEGNNLDFPLWGSTRTAQVVYTRHIHIVSLIPKYIA